jgi:hypothetical protein
MTDSKFQILKESWFDSFAGGILSEILHRGMNGSRILDWKNEILRPDFCVLYNLNSMNSIWSREFQILVIDFPDYRCDLLFVNDYSQEKRIKAFSPEI